MILADAHESLQLYQVVSIKITVIHERMNNTFKKVFVDNITLLAKMVALLIRH